jgi:two-component system response regulator AlgR
VLIADDEAPARARLSALLAEVGPEHRLVGEAANGREVVEICTREDVDVVLLDIRMPGMDGIEAALRLGQTPSPPAVVFVTAYEQHALEAFDANAIDYLLKPVRPDRLARALDKARALSVDQQSALAGTDRYINASYRGGLVHVHVNDVSLLRADRKYVEVWHRGGMALTEESLRAIEERLPDTFLRVHRNALIAPTKARELRRETDGRLLVTVEGCDEPIEVSRRHAPEVRAVLRRLG